LEKVTDFVSTAVFASILNLANGKDSCCKSTMLMDSNESFMTGIEGSTPVYIRIRSVMPLAGEDRTGAEVGAFVDKGTLLDTGIVDCGAMEGATNTGAAGREIGVSIGTADVTDDGVGGGALRMI
jgi:hypothetical protein